MVPLGSLPFYTAHTKLDGINREPTNLFSRRVNIDRAVEFLRKDGVNFPGDPVRGELGTEEGGGGRWY